MPGPGSTYNTLLLQQNLLSTVPIESQNTIKHLCRWPTISIKMPVCDIAKILQSMAQPIQWCKTLHNSWGLHVLSKTPTHKHNIVLNMFSQTTIDEFKKTNPEFEFQAIDIPKILHTFIFIKYIAPYTKDIVYPYFEKTILSNMPIYNLLQHDADIIAASISLLGIFDLTLVLNQSIISNVIYNATTLLSTTELNFMNYINQHSTLLQLSRSNLTIEKIQDAIQLGSIKNIIYDYSIARIANLSYFTNIHANLLLYSKLSKTMYQSIKMYINANKSYLQDTHDCVLKQLSFAIQYLLQQNMIS